MADTPDLPPLSSDPAPPETSPKPSPKVPSPASPPRSGFLAGLHGLWTLVVRLMILGTGVSLGWLAGVLVAQALPSRSPEPPLSEVALRYGSQTGRKLRQLPRWWQGGAPVSDGVEVEPLPPAGGAPAIEGSAETSGAEDSGAELPLTESERDRIADDLSSLQQDLASLSARVAELETSLGTAPSGPLEDRLQQLDQRLSPEAETAPAAETTDSAAGETPTPAATDRVPYQEPRFAQVSDRVVLPSALLFAPGSSTLTAPGQQLLDSIVSDLARYGAATLLVGSHTDGIAPDQASQLTLQQAVAVQQHLAPQLGDEGIRWVPVGYGQTRLSATGTTAADRQRNQRVEIGIVPRN